MNDTTKGELVIVLLISLLAIGCGTACGINNVVENICGNIIPSSLTETEDIIDEIENNNVSLQVSNESVNNIDYVGNEIHKDKSKINDNKTSTVDNNTNNKNVDKNNTNTPNTNNTKSIDTSSNNNQSINNTHEENIPKPLKTLKKTGEKYFTNNSNLVTRIEELV